MYFHSLISSVLGIQFPICQWHSAIYLWNHFIYSILPTISCLVMNRNVKWFCTCRLTHILNRYCIDSRYFSNIVNFVNVSTYFCLSNCLSFFLKEWDFSIYIFFFGRKYQMHLLDARHSLFCFCNSKLNTSLVKRYCRTVSNVFCRKVIRNNENYQTFMYLQHRHVTDFTTERWILYTPYKLANWHHDNLTLI
jgi:hypothetical protein